MRATLLLLAGWGVLAVLGGGAASGWAMVETPAVESWQPVTAEIGASEVITWSAYLPFVARVAADGCQPIPGEEYGTLDVRGALRPIARPSNMPTSTWLCAAMR